MSIEPRKSLTRLGAGLPQAPGPGPSRGRQGGRTVVDAEFRVVPPLPRLWLWLKRNWWALGPYVAYCAALWAAAAAAAFLYGGRAH